MAASMKSSVTSLTNSASSAMSTTTASGSTSATESTFAPTPGLEPRVTRGRRSGGNVAAKKNPSIGARVAKVSAGARVAKVGTGARVAKVKVASNNPSYKDMIVEAVKELKDRKGSSRVAILKFISNKYRLEKDDNMVKSRLKLALRNAVKNGLLEQVKGTGASGSFKLSALHKTGYGKATGIKPKPRGRPAGTGKVAKKAVAKPKAPKVDARKKSVKNRPPTPMVHGGRSRPVTGAPKKVVKRASVARLAKPRKSDPKTKSVSKRAVTPKRASTSKIISARKSASPRKAGRSRSATPRKTATATKSQSLTSRRAAVSRSSAPLPHPVSESVSSVGRRSRR